MLLIALISSCYNNNQQYTSTIFYFRVKVFINTLDIHTICFLAKLSYYHLRSYIVEKQVRPMLYCLKLLLVLLRLPIVFNIVKLTVASDNPISGRHSNSFPNTIIIDKEEKQKFEKNLNSHQYCRMYQYLIKWNGFDLRVNL